MRLVKACWIFEFKESADKFQVQAKCRVLISQQRNDNEDYTLKTSDFSKNINNSECIPFKLLSIRRKLKLAAEINESLTVGKQTEVRLIFLRKTWVNSIKIVLCTSLSHLEPSVIDFSFNLREPKFKHLLLCIFQLGLKKSLSYFIHGHLLVQRVVKLVLYIVHAYNKSVDEVVDFIFWFAISLAPRYCNEDSPDVIKSIAFQVH